jgi:hypothetical protein
MVLSVSGEAALVVALASALMALRALFVVFARALWLLPDWIAKWQRVLFGANQGAARAIRTPARAERLRRRAARDDQPPQ